MKPKSLGQIAYEAFHGCLHWAHLSGVDRYQWAKVASAVAREVRRRERKKR